MNNSPASNSLILKLLARAISRNHRSQFCKEKGGLEQHLFLDTCARMEAFLAPGKSLHQTPQNRHDLFAPFEPDRSKVFFNGLHDRVETHAPLVRFERAFEWAERIRKFARKSLVLSLRS